MESDLILGLVIHALDDIDLSALRPCAGSDHPVSRPDRASVWHSPDVCDNQTGVVGLFGRNANPASDQVSILSSSRRGRLRISILTRTELGGVVDSQDGRAIALNVC